MIREGQHAVRQVVAKILPGIPHQLDQFHYLRKAGRVRVIEHQVEERTDPEAEVIRGYCAAVRGALSETGHPPLELGGLQLPQRLTTIEASLKRQVLKGGEPRS